MFQNRSVVCTAPWYEIRINSDGSVSYCHHAMDSSCQPQESFVTWFNKGDAVSSVRSSIQQGRPVDGCNECYVDESKLYLSHRHKKNFQGAIYQHAFDESFRSSPAYDRMQSTQVQQLPSFVHVSLSNLCNLSCRMCQPKYSTNLQQTLHRAGLVDSNVQVSDWTTGPAWQDFLNLIMPNPNLISVHFMGGEPLLHRKFYEFVDYCIDNNKTDFHLTFVTNATFLTLEKIQKLNQFKSVQIEVSVENFHPTNNYIRLGSDFENIKNNILAAKQALKSESSIVLRTVFQALSAMHYRSILEFALEYNLNIDNNYLLSNKFLHVSVLPAEIKLQILNQLTEFKNSLPDPGSKHMISVARNQSEVIADLHRVIGDLIGILTEVDPPDIDVQRRNFISFNSKIDSVSHKHFLNFYPELKPMYEKYSATQN